MNTAQVQGMRELHEATKSVVRQTYTSRQMAELPHSLSRTGEFATLASGRVFLWDDRFQHWASWA